MALVDINWHPSRRDLKQFALIWFPAFCALIGYFMASAGNWTVASIIWGVAAVVAVVGFLQPPIIRPLFVGLMLVTFPIGLVVSYLLLAFIFFAVVTPIGLLMRLVGYDPMTRAIDKEAESYWVAYNPQSSAERYFRQF